MRPAHWVLKSCSSGLSLFLGLLVLVSLSTTPAAAQSAPSIEAPAFTPAPIDTPAPHPAYDALRAAFDRYQEIAASGGWPSIPEGPTMVTGETVAPERLDALVARLEAEGDLTPGAFRGGYSGEPETSFETATHADTELRTSSEREPAVYGALLSEAVRRFQERHGLEVDGKVGPNTLAALNVPVGERLDQIELNLERWRTTPTDLPERRIEINLAAQRLTTFEDGRPAHEMKVVVGKPTSPTPTFRDRVTHVILRPYWNVPAGITARELVPEARRSPSSLAARGFEVHSGGRWVSPTAVDWSGSGYRIRQRPGNGNSLGLVKFNLAGQTLIYLHDTPEKHGFQRSARALSHGCVRLERPFDLAEWLLAGEPGWTPEKVRSAATRGGEQWVNLNREVPVYSRYFTAWADDAGRVQFRDDVYQEDPGLLARVKHRKALEAERLAGGERPADAAPVATGGAGRR